MNSPSVVPAFRVGLATATVAVMATLACAIPVQGAALPAVPESWKFRLDPDDAGHQEKWFDLDVDDSGWRNVKIGATWESQGIDYDGVAWYRVRMTLPETPKNKRLIIQFGAVDEEAWIFVNGVPAGEHAKGEGGWANPFDIDVTKHAKAGEPNLIAVRVHDRRMAGGIWKPVTLQFVADKDSPWAQTTEGKHTLQREHALEEARKAIKDTKIPILNCENLGYWQQLEYHQTWLSIQQETLERWTLDEHLAKLADTGQPIPQAMNEKLREYEKRDAMRSLVTQMLPDILELRSCRKREQVEKAAALEKKLAAAKERISELTDRPVVAATEKWADARERVKAVQKPYGWHVAKLTLLRDLIHRRQRIHYYLTQEMPPTDPEMRLAAMTVSDPPPTEFLDPFPGTSHFAGRDPLEQRLNGIEYATQRFRDLYGDCYFGEKIQPLLLEAELASRLESQTIELVEQIQALNKSREALETDVLEVLGHFDKDGKFTSLGIPYRDPAMRMEPDGRTSQLVFKCSLEFGGVHSAAHSEALCFDITNLWYMWEIPLKAPGVLGDTWRGQWPDVRKLGYSFNQDVTVLSHKNTAVVDKSFREEHKDDPDILMRGASGNYDKPNFLNFWHPAVRKMIAANLQAIARYSKTQPGFQFYDKLVWEPGLGEPGPGFQIGYNRYAKTAFREYLHKKFGNVERLNQRWRSRYGSFEEISQPDPAMLGQPARVTPLIREFEAFQDQSWVDYLTMCVESIRQEDPLHPVAGETYSGAYVLRNTYNIARQVPLQYLDHHSNASVRNYADTHWLYDLCLHTGKFPVEHEYVWTYPRTETAGSEEAIRVTATLSVWRKMVWGYKMLHPFGLFNGWNYNHGRSDERYTVLKPILGHTIDMGLLREAATAITVGKKRAGEFWPILSRTDVAQPGIGLVSEGGNVQWDQLLRSRDYGFRYLPKQLIADQPEALSAYRVLILPLQSYDGRRKSYPPNFPDGLDNALLSWTKAGGTLICSGLPGLHDAYGFENGRLMRQAFGDGISWEYTGQDGYPAWKIKLANREQLIRDELPSAGAPVLISADFGDGRVVVSTEPLLGAKLIHRQMQAVLFRYLHDAIGLPAASSDRHRFEMVMREDKNGRRYLFIVNPDLHQRIEDLVTVKGEYQQVTDLGISSICSVPLAPRKPVVVKRKYYTQSEFTGGGTDIQVDSSPGSTSFFMQLQPGEGTVLELIP
jgi:hypothetical protein